ncbi:MAG: septal ring lytic transglycosylase RlpA family protein [Gammaproteobacteria bacterium]
MFVFKVFCYLFSAALLTAVLQACSTESVSQPKVQKEKEPAFEQTGKASWYGPGFHGEQTANGEIFNQNELSAAHRSLPLGTEVEVTNVKTGKSVELEINDRGPYVKDRVIDLSRAAAIDLGIKEKGLATVKIEADSVPKKKGGTREMVSKDGGKKQIAR